MPRFEVIKKSFGPINPGEMHRILAPGTIVVREPGDKPGDSYKALDAEAPAPADPSAMSAAKRRAAKAAETPAEETPPSE